MATRFWFTAFPPFSGVKVKYYNVKIPGILETQLCHLRWEVQVWKLFFSFLFQYCRRHGQACFKRNPARLTKELKYDAGCVKRNTTKQVCVVWDFAWLVCDLKQDKNACAFLAYLEYTGRTLHWKAHAYMCKGELAHHKANWSSHFRQQIHGGFHLCLSTCLHCFSFKLMNWKMGIERKSQESKTRIKIKMRIKNHKDTINAISITIKITIITKKTIRVMI